MRDLEYLRPESIGEAVQFLNADGRNTRILAGGTDLIVALREKVIVCDKVMDIKAIDGLGKISWSPEDGLSIGAAVCLSDVIDSGDVKKSCPMLVYAAKDLANCLVRNRATLVGNLCNASPGGDMLCPSIVLEGQVEAVSLGGTRTIPLRDFFSGVKKTVLRENELAVKAVFPPLKGVGRYMRRSRIKGHDLAQVSAAAFLKENGGLNIAVGAAGPVPIVIDGFENLTKADLADNKPRIIEKVQDSIKPIGDQRSSREYRQSMAAYLVGQIIDELGAEVSV